jgi:hypothetical protein
VRGGRNRGSQEEDRRPDGRYSSADDGRGAGAGGTGHCPYSGLAFREVTKHAGFKALLE